MTNFLDKLKKGMNIKNIAEEKEPEDIKEPEKADLPMPLKPEELNKEELEQGIKEEEDGTIRTAGIKDFVLGNIKEVEKKEKKTKKRLRTEMQVEKTFEAPKDKKNWLDPEGQLVIDVYEVGDEIIIQSAIAGISPENLDISIDKDAVSIKGHREKTFEKRERNYLIEECYWGSFSREVILPTEIDAAKAEASMKNGILTIKAPKIEREKKKLSVR